jgi:hypothetical protein
MGATESKATSRQDILNESILSVFTSQSTSVSSSVASSNILNLSHSKGSRLHDINQTNDVTINFDVLADLASTGELQTQLANKLTSTIEQKQNALGLSSQNIDIASKVKNVVNNSISVQNMVNASASVTQLNVIDASYSEDAGDYDINQNNSVKEAMKIANKLSSNVMSTLGITNEASTTATQVTTNPISEAINAITGMFSSPFVVLGLVIICGLFIMKQAGGVLGLGGPQMKMIKYMMIALFLILVVSVVGYGVYTVMNPPKKSSFYVCTPQNVSTSVT